MNLSCQFQHMLAPERVPICIPDHRQIPESEYVETICDAIQLADTADEFRIIRAAIGSVGGTVNRESLRMMLEAREKEVA